MNIIETKQVKKRKSSNDKETINSKKRKVDNSGKDVIRINSKNLKETIIRKHRKVKLHAASIGIANTKKKVKKQEI